MTLRIDHPNFSFGKVNNKLNPKQDKIKIPISFKSSQDLKDPKDPKKKIELDPNDPANNGRLTIVLNKTFSWVYYLQAEN